MPNIPALERFCGSWIIVSRSTGQPIAEIFTEEAATAVNQACYEVLTAYQWLSRFNASTRAASRAEVIALSA